MFDPREAMRPTRPCCTRRTGPIRAPTLDLPDVPNLCSYLVKTQGDVEQGFREADLVLEHTYHTPMQHQGYIEPHSCLVSVEADGADASLGLEQGAVRRHAAARARPRRCRAEQVILEPTFVGGDFGGKGSPMQMPLAYFLSQRDGPAGTPGHGRPRGDAGRQPPPRGLDHRPQRPAPRRDASSPGT